MYTESVARGSQHTHTYAHTHSPAAREAVIVRRYPGGDSEREREPGIKYYHVLFIHLKAQARQMGVVCKRMQCSSSEKKHLEMKMPNTWMQVGIFEGGISKASSQLGVVPATNFIGN